MIRPLPSCRAWFGLWLVICAGVLGPAYAVGADEVARPVEFERDVAPLLVTRCLECHNERAASGGLVLATRAQLLAGGESGAAVVVGEADASYLLDRVIAGEMPPLRQGQSQQLPPEEIATLRNWIQGGLEWPAERQLDLFESTSATRAGRDWWSLQPVRTVSPPDGDAAHPVDAFIRRQLREQNLTPAPPADRRTLIRRAYLDLIGLPPTADAIARFEQDDGPLAWERLIDELLASPEYGQRWARMWLDVVRYADTSGYERDQEKPFSWKYRDWVVDALNDDKPYDRFILEQLAGDELPDRSESTVIATGFLRLGTWNDEPNDPQDYKYERLEDLVHATSSAFLGMTVKCARCHDHKFDPIPQLDYYRLASVFWPGPIEPRDRALLGGPTADELGAAEVLGWTDVTRTPSPLHLLKNGERHHPLQAVEPATLSFLPQLARPLAPPADDVPTTQRRLQLARWIASPEHPLTARVLVNRVWQQHFGFGLVRSANNFGFTGDQPTHPELLDYLADRFMREGWRWKPLHRLLLTSLTYQQSADHPAFAEYAQRDFDNRWLWHTHRRRLDAEALRDATLAVSGELDVRLAGRGFRPSVSPEALEGLSRKSAAWEAAPAAEQRRRSLYLFSQRSLLPPFMTTFDFSDTTLPCAQRDVTTVAPQALALLNDQFIFERSVAVARRAAEGPDAGLDGQIDRAFRLVLARAPSAEERAFGKTHVERQLARFAESRARLTKAEHNWRAKVDGVPQQDLALHLAADQGVKLDSGGRVQAWSDQSGRQHHATQAIENQRPVLIGNAHHARPAVRFDGARRFLHLAEPLLTTDKCTIFAVVTDSGPPGPREILSNWSGRDGNSGQSLFLGLTSQRTVRFSDQFAAAGEIERPQELFVLTAVNGRTEVHVYQNGATIASRSSPLEPRRLDTPWVIGQQGNIDGEFWHGDLAELLVYDRELSEAERRHVWNWLFDKYQLTARIETPPPVPAADILALASLCQVLMNTNEFLYVD